MHWVILCASYWTLYDTLEGAKTDLALNNQAATQEGCGSPIEASESEVLYYKSHEFKPALIGDLSTLTEVKKYDDDRKKAQEREKNEQEQQDHNSTPSLNPEVVKEALAEPASESKEKHCFYWFVYIAPHTLKMMTKCDEDEKCNKVR